MIFFEAMCAILAAAWLALAIVVARQVLSSTRSALARGVWLGVVLLVPILGVNLYLIVESNMVLSRRADISVKPYGSSGSGINDRKISEHLSDPDNIVMLRNRIRPKGSSNQQQNRRIV